MHINFHFYLIQVAKMTNIIPKWPQMNNDTGQIIKIKFIRLSLQCKRTCDTFKHQQLRLSTKLHAIIQLPGPIHISRLNGRFLTSQGQWRSTQLPSQFSIKNFQVFNGEHTIAWRFLTPRRIWHVNFVLPDKKRRAASIWFSSLHILGILCSCHDSPIRIRGPCTRVALKVSCLLPI